MTRRKYSEQADHNEVINKLYESIRSLANENKQLSLAIGGMKPSKPWPVILKEIKRKNKAYGELLNKAYVVYFTCGRIRLIFKSLTIEERSLLRHGFKRWLKIWLTAEVRFPIEVYIRIKD